jgi:hypothetical protein
MNYVITEHDELLTKAQAEKYNYKIIRKPTKAEIIEHEKEEAYWLKQSEEEQHRGSHHELPW